MAEFARGDDEADKVSIRDIPFALERVRLPPSFRPRLPGKAWAAQRRLGGTTVAATATLAAQAGIRVFATGGIGGVHRGGAESWDVSADLDVLGRTPIAVVCAGAKSILDIPLTLQYLVRFPVHLIATTTSSGGRV